MGLTEICCHRAVHDTTSSMAPLSLEQTGDREAEEDINTEPMLLILLIRHTAVARVPPCM